MTSKSPQLRLQALLLADHVYRDEDTGKHVIAGTFHQIDVGAVPATMSQSIGAFVSLLGVDGPTGIDVRFIERDSGEVLLGPRTLEVAGTDPQLPVEFAVQLPPLPLPRSGRYAVQVSTAGGLLGEAPVAVRAERTT